MVTWHSREERAETTAETETTNTAPSPIPRFRLPAGVGWTLKLLLILFLLVPALIALALITSMVRDRENFERDAIRDIAERWGGEQRIVGPFLTLTCTDTFTHREEREGLADVIRTVEDRDTYSFTAESVDLSVDLAPESRRRGLFQAIVYSATAEVDATFASKAALEERLPKPRGSRDCAARSRFARAWWLVLRPAHRAGTGAVDT